MTTRKTYTYEQLIELFDEELDAQGVITIAGARYLPSHLLECTDQLHYDLTFDAWKDSMGYREIESGDGFFIDGYYNIHDTPQTEGEQA